MSQIGRSTHSLDAVFHPASCYDSPEDVLSDAELSVDEKRAILSSWASDMYVVESEPGVREVPGIPQKLRLDDIMAALKRLDSDNDPPRGGGLALRPFRFSRLDCVASGALPRVSDELAATRRSRPAKLSHAHKRWTREANVRRYRKLLATQLTETERRFIERRLVEELQRRT
jgi:hypothetical protein